MLWQMMDWTIYRYVIVSIFMIAIFISKFYTKIRNLKNCKTQQMNKEILKKALAKWGKETQMNKIQEEALELALILNQRKCPTKNAEEMEEALYDELADMKIMMAQAELIFDADRINLRVDYKLNKLNTKYLSDVTLKEI